MTKKETERMLAFRLTVARAIKQVEDNVPFSHITCAFWNDGFVPCVWLYANINPQQGLRVSDMGQTADVIAERIYNKFYA